MPRILCTSDGKPSKFSTVLQDKNPHDGLPIFGITYMDNTISKDILDERPEVHKFVPQTNQLKGEVLERQNLIIDHFKLWAKSYCMETIADPTAKDRPSIPTPVRGLIKTAMPSTVVIE